MGIISLKVDPDALGKPKRFTAALRNEIRFITSLALNSTMNGTSYLSGTKSKNVRTALEGSSKGFLDKPTKGVEKGWFLKEKSTKSHLAAGLDYKDRPYPVYRYLAPHIFGLKRKQKKAEAALGNHPLNKGLPPGSLLVPKNDNFKRPLKIDRYGNVPKKTWEYIYDNAATTTRSESGNPSFLIGRPRHGNRPAGIWWRRKGNEQLWMIFKAVPNAQYRPIYKAESVMDTSVGRLWEKNLDAAMYKVINPWLH